MRYFTIYGHHRGRIVHPIETNTPYSLNCRVEKRSTDLSGCYPGSEVHFTLVTFPEQAVEKETQEQLCREALKALETSIRLAESENANYVITTLDKQMIKDALYGKIK
jgi:hypothetical protein